VLRHNYGRGAGTSRSIFSLSFVGHTDLDESPTRSVWRFHVPRIWIRSINGRKFSVKRKTQNVGDVFVLHLSVVVPFLINHLRLNAFRGVAAHATLLASKFKMKRALPLLSIFFLLLLHLFAQTPATTTPPDSAPSILPAVMGQKLHIAGIPNAGKVTDILYRGAQPQEVGLSQLKIMGVTTIVDLRSEDPGKITWERQHAESLGMRFVNIPVNGWSPPSDEQVVQFLSLLHDHPGQKIFVHCRFGEDRTSVFVAAYRIASEKWPAEKAISEMYFFGFNGRWHPSMKTFVQNFPSRMNSAPGLAALRAPASQP
jgi:tyrosine-protein phosphatase SIW14